MLFYQERISKLINQLITVSLKTLNSTTLIIIMSIAKKANIVLAKESLTNFQNR